MTRRGTASRRSKAEWICRGLLALGLAGLAYVTLATTLATFLRESDPARAHAMFPGDGRITALLARKLAGPDATPTNRARADLLARAALRQDPTAVPAVTTLAVDTELRGDGQGAVRLFSYAEHLSRRDLLTQLWAVEDAVRRGDVAGALKHYDIALRTNDTARNLLFPVLGTAMSEPAVRAALVRTLAARPGWSAGFIQYAAASGADPQATASLFRALGRSGVPVPQEAQAAVLAALLSRNLLVDAWSHYRWLHPQADRRFSRDPVFAADAASPSPFDWVPLNDAGVSASIQRGSRGGIVDFAAPASVGGPLLQQVQLLPPGIYSLAGHSIGIEQPDGSHPYWALTCRDGQELGRVDVPNSAVAGGMFSGRIAVPAGCPVQTLALVARPSDAAGGLAGQIDRVRLEPAR